MTPTAAMKPKLVEKLQPLEANPASVLIPVNKIIRSETNRKVEVDAAFIESIHEHGVLQPIIVRKIIASAEDIAAHMLPKPATPLEQQLMPFFEEGETIYRLVAGERRLLGARRDERTSIPAVIRELTDTQAIEIQVEENEQRKDLSPMDRSVAYTWLRDQYMKDHAGDKGYTESKCIQDVAANRKVEVRTVYQVIALGKLEPSLQHALRNGEMEASHAYEFCRLESVQQTEMLLWLRQQTHHSQGDVPSVRRLKRQIAEMQIVWDEKKRQAELPLDGAMEGNAAVDGLYPKALQIVHEVGREVRKVSTQLLQRRLNIDSKPAQELLVRMEREGIVGAEIQGFRWYAQTSAEAQKPETKTVRAGFAGTREIPIEKPKPLSEAQIKKNEEAAAKQAQQLRKQQDEFEKKRKISAKYDGLFFSALAGRVQISSRFLTHVVPVLFSELWDGQRKMPSNEFVQHSLGWPAPKDPRGYTRAEAEAYTVKHTRKYTPKILATLVLFLHMQEHQTEKLARYFGVDLKKLRKQAAAQVKDEDRAAAKKKGAAA